MAEVRDVADTSFTYAGIFEVKEIFKILDEFCSQKGYVRKEKVNKEIVSENSKDISSVSICERDITDYCEIHLKVIIDVRNVKDVEVTIDKKPRKMQQGEVSMIIKAIVVTDYEGKWEGRAAHFFLRTLMDKYIYRKEFNDYRSTVTGDMNFLRDQIRGYLNMQRTRV